MYRSARAFVAGIALALLLAGCIHLSHSSAPTTTTPSTVPRTTTTTKVPGVQSTGIRTVLSPIGLNVRQRPSKSAKILASAAQGVAFTVFGHAVNDGVWYAVRGQSVTGWISGAANLSSPGTFVLYQSNPIGFTVLYPTAWTVTPTSAVVVFKGPANVDTVTFRSSPPSVGPLASPPGRVLTGTTTVVPCGVTTAQHTYALPNGSGPLIALVRIPVDPKHDLAIEGVLRGKADLLTFDDFVNSVAFANPQCQGGAP
jgi:hypothetical protein